MINFEKQVPKNKFKRTNSKEQIQKNKFQKTKKEERTCLPEGGWQMTNLPARCRNY